MSEKYEALQICRFRKACRLACHNCTYYKSEMCNRINNREVSDDRDQESRGAEQGSDSTEHN